MNKTSLVKELAKLLTSELNDKKNYYFNFEAQKWEPQLRTDYKITIKSDGMTK